MVPCPPDETLAGLLAEALGTAERDALAQHVERCASCQQRLARLSGMPDTDAWRCAEQRGRCATTGAAVIARLKQIPARPSPAAAVDQSAPDVPGYEIVGELGRGGMGVVYEARQLGHGRTVALKMVRTGTEADLARFRAEAAAIARLRHPNIVRIHDVGEAGGRPYLALEFVAGGSLAEHLRGRPQPAVPAARMVETLARAVHAAHEQGVIHRDLKPGNILLHAERGPSPDGTPPRLTPKITDFGLAKLAGRDGDSTRWGVPTVSGELLGTPSYMAPEQAMLPRQQVGAAADVYALGAILYELLTGRPPFLGDTPLATVLQVLHNEPVRVTSLQPDVPRDLETVCLKCLRKDPAPRYGSALELADDLARFLNDERVRARPPTPLERLRRWVRRRPRLAYQ